jgi:hypothetical protein
MKKLALSGSSPEKRMYLDATLTNIEEALNRLDNQTWTGVTLTDMPNGFIQVFGGNDGRVMVKFRDGSTTQDYQAGILLDNASNPNAEILISISGEATWLPFRHTVTKEIAKSVLLHFLENSQPPNGLAWEGNMGNYR